MNNQVEVKRCVSCQRTMLVWPTVLFQDWQACLCVSCVNELRLIEAHSQKR